MEKEIPHNRDITYFAKTNFRNSDNIFGIKRKDRRQHMYILGKSGTGKSVLLSNLIVQNIQNGEGVCVVDPHGELVEEILHLIPENRTKDVIYFNPADTDFHIGFNVIQLDDPKYKHLVASGLMGIFTKIWANAWSSRMEYILNNSILALLDTPGTTLLGIPRLLVDKDYRQMIISNLKDPVVKAFWVHEYEQWREQFRNEAIAPIQNKVGQFLSTSIIRNVVGQPKSTIDIFKIMNEGKIFLVNVSKGRIGEDQILEAVLEAGCEEVNDLGESFEIVSEPSDLVAVRTALQSAGIDYESADTSFLPSLSVPLDAETATKVFELIDAIEELDDVQNVFGNFDVSDEVMASLG